MAVTGKGELIPFRSIDEATGSSSGRSSIIRDATGDDRSTGQSGGMIAGTRASTARVVPLSFLGSADLILKRPVYAVLEESATGSFVAAAYDLDLAGQGETEFAALDELREQLLELFLALREMKADLPDHLRARLAFLESLVA